MPSVLLVGRDLGKTESVYRRYAIVDEAMPGDAAVKLAARRGQSGVVFIEPTSWKFGQASTSAEAPASELGACSRYTIPLA